VVKPALLAQQVKAATPHLAGCIRWEIPPKTGSTGCKVKPQLRGTQDS